MILMESIEKIFAKGGNMSSMESKSTATVMVAIFNIIEWSKVIFQTFYDFRHYL